MIGKIWYLFLAAFLLPTTAVTAIADDAQVGDYLLNNFYQFVQAFEARENEQLSLFLDGQSKFGQEIGGSAVTLLEYTADGKNCRERLLDALYAGCKQTSESELPGCIAPPQAADSSVLYIGPRIAFTSDRMGKSFKLRFVVCGSD